MSRQKSTKNEQSKFGERLQKIRLSLGLNKKQLAERIGAAASYITQLENGTRTPSRAFVYLVSNTFFVNSNYLERGEGAAFVSPSDRIKELVGDKYEMLKGMGFILRDARGEESGNNTIAQKFSLLDPADQDLIEGLIDRCLEVHGKMAGQDGPAFNNKRKKASGE